MARTSLRGIPVKMSAVQTAQHVAQGLPSSEERDRGEGKLSGQLFELQHYIPDLRPMP